MTTKLNRKTVKLMSALALASATFLSMAANAAMKVEAEDFANQEGIKTESSSDTGGGINVGYIENGDWVEYAVDVPAAGTYTLSARVASATGGGRFVVLANGVEKATVKVKGTGDWQSWKTIESTVDLDAGPQTLRFNFKGSSGYLFNMNWFELSAK
ncbi:carbohydrate-binding protein [Agarivorans sp. MS3-6]|uniref:carbohydrate-binding protein n=1 Tax=Agarivorans sp. TSD2052 TaxID=2937286 RepID=UPI00200D4605|nr:carbohydrate-binding protein [Agarivorans sp. TSD2052]UPW18320.1 carbohydrate-binding protein [Agarivorans sp. TSD2052]